MTAEREHPTAIGEQVVMAWRVENATTVHSDLTQDQDNQNIEATIHTLKMQRLSEYEQPVYISPMSKASLQAPDDTLFPLMDKVKEFLANDCQVMLILGDSRAGKSTFNRRLEYVLWKFYSTGERIPLFINLPALDRPEKELIAEQLRTHRFSDTQIQELEQHRHFVLICDGYDESQLTSNLHTTNALNRSGQRDTKLLITCRSQYLGPDYRIRFVPEAIGKYNRAADDLFMEAVITPFSKEQIEVYVERYVPLEPRTWVKKDYMDKLKVIRNLMDLVRNPFMLTLCLEALPNVVEGKSGFLKLRVTRIQLYDTFVQHWLGVNKRRLQKHKLGGGKLSAFEELLDDGFESNGIRFQQDLAAAIFREQEGRPIVNYTQMRDGDSWKASFFSSDAIISILRGASLLSRIGNQHRFVHRSILERYPLSQRDLIVEPSIIQFLAERVQMDSRFRQQLLDLIEQSKTDNDAACAAANSLTILIKAGVSFVGSDLRGIQVPGADLSGGQFESAQLQGADLTRVNLTRSWIRKADLSEARMEGVQFGELPYLEEVEKAALTALCDCGTARQG
ncbi:WD_REPEATS_REGION domain-containing protein [Linnemannia gamsii]|uniref:WD_REPEATS_REGION domain-containing protein n=1 Tax=Linnemannia gamsii TaxID=64522 RepID=A0ABQ7K8W0_9FUNG|nr:WD_REPEATS_REGION domain-containing protein [Linnemannia gamsii]